MVVGAIPIYCFRPQHPRLLAYAFVGLAVAVIGVTVAQFLTAVRYASRAPRRSLRQWFGVVATGVGVLLALGVALLCLLYLRVTQLEPFRVPGRGGGGMPTLIAGDEILVDERLDRPIARGDLVIFHPTGIEDTYVKRVVALEGDVVETRGHDVWVNGTRLAHEPQDGTGPCPVAVKEAYGGCVTERLPSGRSYELLLSKRPSELTYGPRALTTGEVFVLGGERDNSYDSRSFGTVMRERVVGRPLVVWFSFEGWDIRWSRIGLEL